MWENKKPKQWGVDKHQWKCLFSLGKREENSKKKKKKNSEWSLGKGIKKKKQWEKYAVNETGKRGGRLKPLFQGLFVSLFVQ